MHNYLFRIFLSFIFFSTQVFATRVLDVDQLRSSDRTKTWDTPATSGTLITHSSVDTLRNKTFYLGNNTLDGTSDQLNDAISDNTGSGALVFGTAPTITNGFISGGSFNLGSITNPTITGANISTSTLASPLMTSPQFSSIVNTGTLTLPTSTDTLVGRATSDTLTNKTLGDALTTAQIATPSNPASNYNKIYTKTDGKLYVLDSSGIEKSTGGLAAWVNTTPYTAGDVVTYGGNTYIALSTHTSGTTFESDIQGGKWRLTNTPHIMENLAVAGNNFEDNDVGGWTAMSLASGTNGLPVTVGTAGLALSSTNGGTTKPANLTAPAISTTSGTINGKYSLNFATTGTISAYSGYVSQVYNIPIKYQAKAMVAEVAFKVVSGTFVMGGTSADSMAIAVYSPSENQWLANAGAFSFNQSTGVGIARTTFQTGASTTGLQLYIYSPNSPTGSASFLLDDVSIYKQDVVYGSPVTDAVSITMTLANAGNATITAKESRRGDRALYEGVITIGSSLPTSTIGIVLPSGRSIDTTKLPDTASLVSIVNGQALGNVGGTAVKLYPVYQSSTTIALEYQSTTSSALVVNTTQPVTWANGNKITFSFEVPITGFSSSVVMSSDADTRTIATSAYFVSSGTLTKSAYTKVPFNATSYDLTGSFDTTNSRFVCPTPGVYNLSAYLGFGTPPNDGTLQLVAYKNGSTYKVIRRIDGFSNAEIDGNGDIQCNAGDYIELYYYTSASANPTWANSAASQWVTFHKVSGPSQIASTETVVLSRNNGAGQAINTGVTSNLDFPTGVFDSHGAWRASAGAYNAAAGTFATTQPGYVCPIAGKYLVMANSGFSSGLSTGDINAPALSVLKNGSVKFRQQATGSTAASRYISTSGIVDCLAGDVISITIQQATGANATTYANGADNNLFILRVGN